jgi:hypothetical protein
MAWLAKEILQDEYNVTKERLYVRNGQEDIVTGDELVRVITYSVITPCQQWLNHTFMYRCIKYGPEAQINIKL